MNFLFRLLCTISSLSIAPWIYVVNKGISIPSLCERIGIATDRFPLWFSDKYISALIFFIVILGIAYFCMLISKEKRTFTEIKADKISSIEPAGEDVMLTYLGLFFYAFSVESFFSFWLSFILLSVGCFLTRRYSFNPLYLFFGYHYYNMKVGKKTILMVSKEKIQFNDSIAFERAIKLNEFTFLDTNQ